FHVNVDLCAFTCGCGIETHTDSGAVPRSVRFSGSSSCDGPVVGPRTHTPRGPDRRGAGPVRGDDTEAPPPGKVGGRPRRARREACTACFTWNLARSIDGASGHLTRRGARDAGDRRGPDEEVPRGVVGRPGSPRGQPAAREAGAASDGRSRDAGPGSAAVLGSSDTTATTALLPTFLIPARRVGAKVGALERETAADDDLADDQARGQPSCRHLHRPPGRRRPPRRAVQLEALDGADRTLAFSPVVPEPWLGPGQERPVEHALVARQRVGGEVLRVPVGWGTGLGVVRRRP